MVEIDSSLQAQDLDEAVKRLFDLAGSKIRILKQGWSPDRGTPVFTVQGRYTSRGWTEWTQGFLFGMAILHFDATGEEDSLTFGRESTVAHMAPHLTHIGVHDHGFNNVSTYGNLLRLMAEGRIAGNAWEREYYRLALKASGAVQAARWTDMPDNLGYVYSFNGSHSLFIDTIRTLRSLALGHDLGQVLMAEQDARVSLLERLLRHTVTTARYNVFHGENRDCYDVRGRVSHEAIFNAAGGSYRCPGSQQGYSPFSTWTRGLAWAVLGFAEQLEYVSHLPPEAFAGIEAGDCTTRAAFIDLIRRTAEETADFYLDHSPTDGIPYWDTGAPGLAHLPDHLNRPADPFNGYEPVDSSAAAIAAQGFLRLGHYLIDAGEDCKGSRYLQAGLTTARSLLREPYLSESADHQGLILHAVYHRPNGWDYLPPGRAIPSGESCLWGDYHALETAVLLRRMAQGRYFAFYGI